jgi:hypothetical protein
VLGSIEVFTNIHVDKNYQYATHAPGADDPCVARSYIEKCYDSNVEALKMAGHESVPIHTKNGAKFWWNQKLEDLKINARASHENWVIAGKPRSGPIFHLRNVDKYAYRWHIKQEKLAKSSLSLTNCKTNFVISLNMIFGKRGKQNSKANQKLN